MSIPLKDFRLGITESIDIWLDVEAAASEKDKAFIAREILQEWARKKSHAYRIATKRLHANGLQPELFGIDPAEDGAKRK